jgi:hypothetical protein
VSILLIGLVFSACEKDDFCIQNPVTPKLILGFYDAENRETLKPANNLYVWAENAVRKDSLFKNISTDSLVIPLNRFATETIYNFSKDSIVNQFTVQYTTQDEYVSRSCGFRTVFNNVIFSSNNTWIMDFTTETEIIIDNQNEAHAQIFH